MSELNLIESRHSSRPEASLTAGIRNSSAVLILVALIAGVAWSVVARPAELTVLPGGQVVLSEESSAAQFGVVMLFSGIGALVAGCWGIYCAIRFRPLGPWLIGLAVAGAAIASVLCWAVGVQLGPSDPSSLNHLSGGETLHDKLRVDSIAVFILWPWCAALAAGAVSLFWRSHGHIADQRSNDVDHIWGPQSDGQTPAGA